MKYMMILMVGAWLWGCGGAADDQLTWNKDPDDWNYENYGLITDNNGVMAPLPQKQQERTYEPLATTELETIGWYPESEAAGDREMMLLNVVSLYVDADESHIYIFDSEALSIRKFALRDGRLVTRYGGTSGEGPGELSMPSAFAVTPDGRVLISDSRLRRVSLFDEDGTPRKDVSYPFQVATIVSVSNTEYILAGDYEHVEHYSVYGIEGNLQKTFGKLSEDVMLKGGLAGVLVTGEERNFVQAIGYTGYVMGFSDTFEPVFYRESLDGEKGLPAWLPTERGFRIDQTSLGAVFYKTLNVWQDEFFVRRYDSRGEKGKQMVVDVYDLSNGDYKYSMRSPREACSIYFVTNNHLYTNCAEEGIVVWERP